MAHFVKGLMGLMFPLAVLFLLVGVFYWGSRTPGTASTGEIWTCSMHPQIRQDKPGNCPLCGMKLIPLGQLSGEQEQLARRAQIETEKIQHRKLFKEIRTVGKLDYNESRVAYITSRMAGRVDRVFADFTGIQVKQNDHLVAIYSPELYSAQEELFQALEASEKEPANRRFTQANLEATRTKLLLLGILPEQLQEIEKNRQLSTHLTIYAPMAGTVIEKGIREGQYVKEGDMLYRIAELDPIWLYLDIYESELGWIQYGQMADVTVEAYPGELFKGTVVFVDPFLDDQTRTVKVRVNLKNSEGKLKPAMYASASIRIRLLGDGAPEPTGLEGKFICPMHPEVVGDGVGKCPICEMSLERVPQRLKPPKLSDIAPAQEVIDRSESLAVRASSVLDTGRRQITYRRTKKGNFELVQLRLGPRAEAEMENGTTESFYPVLEGLNPGDEVVVRGGFLLDSQQQISGEASLLYPEGGAATSIHAEHSGHAEHGETGKKSPMKRDLPNTKSKTKKTPEHKH